MNLANGIGVLNLVQNSKISQSISEMNSLIDNQSDLIEQQNLLSEQILQHQALQLDLQMQQLDIQRKQSIANDIELNRKKAARAIKETVFQLKIHLKVIEEQKDNLVKFLLYSITFDELSIDKSHTELVDDITDKEYLVDTLDALESNIQACAQLLSNSDKEKLLTLNESSRLYETFITCKTEQSEVEKLIEKINEKINEVKNRSIKTIKKGIFKKVEVPVLLEETYKNQDNGFKFFGVMVALASLTGIGEHEYGMAILMIITGLLLFNWHKIPFSGAYKYKLELQKLFKSLEEHKQTVENLTIPLTRARNEYNAYKPNVEKFLSEYPSLEKYISLNDA